MKLRKKYKLIVDVALTFVVEVWVFLEIFFQMIGLGKHTNSFYLRACRKPKKLYLAYSFFLAALYRKKYFNTEVDTSLVFLDCFWGRKIGDHPYAIYKEIKEDKSRQWKFVWVKNANVAIPDNMLNDPSVEFVEHRSVAYVLNLLKAGVLVCNSNFLPFFARREGQIFINTWHGIPLKTLGLDTPRPIVESLNTQRNFNQSTVIPMSSDWAAEKIVGSYGASLAKGGVVEVGSPRIDVTLRSDIRKFLNHAEGAKIILYAPTWRGSIGSVSKNIKQQIDAVNVIKYSAGKNSILYVSLHHLTRVALGKLPEDILLIPDNIDICEFVSAVDVLVSDYSSVFIDYLVLDRPVILHVPDLEEYQEKRGLLLDVKDLPVNVTHSGSELSRVFSSLKKPSEFSSYEYYRNLWIPNEDGRAAKRCWEVAASSNGSGKADGGRKTILIYGGMLANNGITHSLLNLLKFIDKQVYDVHVAFPASLGRPGSPSLRNMMRVQQYAEVVLLANNIKMTASELVASGFSKHRLPYFGKMFKGVLNRYFRYESRRQFAGYSFDYYIDFTGYSFFWSMLAPHIEARKRIAYLHSDMYEEWKNEDKNMRRLGAIFENYKNYDCLVSVSNAVYEANNKKLEQFIAAKTKAVAVPNCYDAEEVIELSAQDLFEVSEGAAAFLNYHEEASVFITISRLSPEKNLTMIVEAFAELRKKRQDAVLVIVGSGNEAPKLKAQTNMLGLADCIYFTGFVENPHPLLKRADCLLFPSKYEGQGLVLLEALTLGKFCVAADIPAAREILEDGYGALVAPTVQAFSDALLWYCEENPVASSFDYKKYSEHAIQSFNELVLNA